MPWQTLDSTQTIGGVFEVAAWPTLWVLRGETVVPTLSHTLYGYDVAARQPAWTLTGLKHGPITWHNCPSLVRAGDVVVAATYVGKRRDQVWLIALDPPTGALRWRRPLAWHRGKSSGGKMMETAYAGLTATAHHLIVFENSDEARSAPVIHWLDPATGESLFTCPGPEISRPIVAAGGYLYISDASMSDDQGLYRVPAEPGGAVEKLLLDTRVSSLVAAGDFLYAAHSPNLLEWTVSAWDARTFAPQAAWQIALSHDARDFYTVDFVLPGAPHRLIMHTDETYRAIDLCSNAILWEQIIEFGLLHFIPTPLGLLSHHPGQAPFLLDLATGERTATDLGRAEAVLAVGDALIASLKYFSPDCRFYSAAETPLPPPTPASPAAPPTRLRDLLPDLLTDPRDAVENLVTKAARSRSLTAFFKEFRPLMGVGQLHKKVKDFLIALKAGELDAGLLHFNPFAELHRGTFFYPDLFGFGPEERFFPGVAIGYETYGVEFYLMLETGMVLSLHHDATFSEVASEVWEDCEGHVLAFERSFPERGALLDIAQLTRFQQEFADCDRVERLGDLAPADFFIRTARAFGWTLRQLQTRIEDTRLEFLYHYYRDHEDALAALIEEHITPK